MGVAHRKIYKKNKAFVMVDWSAYCYMDGYRNDLYQIVSSDMGYLPVCTRLKGYIKEFLEIVGHGVGEMMTRICSLLE